MKKTKAEMKKENPFYKRTYKWKKNRIFEAYGGYKCKFCGETKKEFLTIDHINDDGARHRREIAKIRPKTYFYKWLWENNFPDGFQVLCRNCNWGKYIDLRKKRKEMKKSSLQK
jgi:hypothetical protein